MLELNIETIVQVTEHVSEDVKRQKQATKEMWLKELKEAVERGKNKTLESIEGESKTTNGLDTNTVLTYHMMNSF